MEEKKEMTFAEELDLLIDDYQEKKRLEQEKAEEERKKKRDYYLKARCRAYAAYGNHRARVSSDEASMKASVVITLDDMIAFAVENNMKYDLFIGENAIEFVMRIGKPEFCEEPPKDLLITEEDADEPSAESATEAIEKMVAGMTKEPKSGEDDDETAEKDLMGPLSEEETADVVGRLRRATSERQAEASEENYSFDTGV